MGPCQEQATAQDQQNTPSQSGIAETQRTLEKLALKWSTLLQASGTRETAIQVHRQHFVTKFIFVSISLTLSYCSLHKRLPSQRVFDIHHVPQSQQLLERQQSPHQALISLCAQTPNETIAVHELVSMG